ncbi:MAG: hypothetical protein ORN54_00105, partial [Cyclobacteriaceae bacterium]|nr:hypothetical protein [Cyclobacteriaceae bacterium]
ECALGKFCAFHLFYLVGKGEGFNRPPSASQTVGSNAATRNKMRTHLLVFLSMLTSWTMVLGQDGSDILYVTAGKLSKSYIGDIVHLDFYKKSFRGQPVDTIIVKIKNNQVRFVERRKDNGFNNWFNEQFLESVDNVDGKSIKIIKSRLDKITTDSIFVTDYLEFFANGKLEKTEEFKNRFSRTMIAAVLVSADSHKQKVK